jgi:CubicO group peptidase (beta-lactamase class C family)
MLRAMSWRFPAIVGLALVAGCATWRAASIGSTTQPFLERTLAHAQAVHGFPAAAAAMITSSEIHVAALGRRRVDQPDLVTIDDRFGLGSNTKAFTAAMLGALVERGLLRWDLTLAEAFSDLPMRPEYRAVTLRQLLTHRGGLQPWTSVSAFALAQKFFTGDLTTTRLAFARAVLVEPPITVPGTENRYSNADYIVASLVGERAAHHSWEQLVTDLVCSPLKIDCRFAASNGDRNQPWAHSRSSGVLLPIDPATLGPPVMEGAGGLRISIKDYAVFVQANLRGLRGIDTPMLRASTIRELHQPVDGPYGLGWHTQQFAGALSSIHAGGNSDFYAVVAIQRERDRSVAFLTNDGGDDVESQASAVLKELLAGPPTPRGARAPQRGSFTERSGREKK